MLQTVFLYEESEWRFEIDELMIHVALRPMRKKGGGGGHRTGANFNWPPVLSFEIIMSISPVITNPYYFL